MEVVGGVRDRVVQKERKGRQHSAKPMAVEEGVSTWGVRKALKGVLTFALLMEVESDAAFTEVAIEQREGNPAFEIRHGGGKRCKIENCTKSVEGLEYFCKAHGGGKRCTFTRSTKGAEGSTSFCKGHGGGKRCSFQGGEGVCTKSVHGGTLYCVSHGGGKRCAIAGCSKSARDERTSVSAMVEGKGANPKVVKRACREVPISARRMEEESGVCGANEVQDSVQTVRPLVISLQGVKLVYVLLIVHKFTTIASVVMGLLA